jgi:hypothetical protein
MFTPELPLFRDTSLNNFGVYTARNFWLAAVDIGEKMFRDFFIEV